jgi:hypothetical protein
MRTGLVVDGLEQEFRSVSASPAFLAILAVLGLEPPLLKAEGLRAE